MPGKESQEFTDYLFERGVSMPMEFYPNRGSAAIGALSVAMLWLFFDEVKQCVFEEQTLPARFFSFYMACCFISLIVMINEYQQKFVAGLNDAAVNIIRKYLTIMSTLEDLEKLVAQDDRPDSPNSVSDSSITKLAISKKGSNVNADGSKKVMIIRCLNNFVSKLNVGKEKLGENNSEPFPELPEEKSSLEMPQKISALKKSLNNVTFVLRCLIKFEKTDKNSSSNYAVKMTGLLLSPTIFPEFLSWSRLDRAKNKSPYFNVKSL